MVNPLKISKILISTLIVFFACQPEEETMLQVDPIMQDFEAFISDAKEKYTENTGARIATDEYTLCQEPMVYDLVSWPNNKVGTVEISNTESLFLVSYSLQEGLSLNKTSLAVFIDQKTVSSRGHGSFLKYVYPVKHDVDVGTYTYEIPLSDLGEGVVDFEIAASAHIVKGSGNKSRWGSHAIAMENTISKKHFYDNWLIDYTLAECQEEICEIIGAPSFLYGDIPPYISSSAYNDGEFDLDDWDYGFVITLDPTESDFDGSFNVTLFKGEELVTVSKSAKIWRDNDRIAVQVYMKVEYYINKSYLYVSKSPPTSGIPCNFNYSHIFGEEEFKTADNYTFTDYSNDDKLYLIYYADISAF